MKEWIVLPNSRTCKIVGVIDEHHAYRPPFAPLVPARMRAITAPPDPELFLLEAKSR